MKKLLLPLLSILLFTACQKEITTTKAKEEIAGATANKQTKMSVCHYDAVTGTSKTIIITDQKALAAHLAHGDVQGECSTIQTITICSQVWMVKNLDVDHYRNGDPIPQVTDQTEWGALTTGAWCYYENTSANGTTYGKLYNWYAINDPRGLTPTGWHVPTLEELTTLANCLGGTSVAGGPLKSLGTIEDGTGLWFAPNTDATNSSGFTALPGGFRVPSLFFGIGQYGYLWSSSEIDFPSAWSLFLYNGGGSFNLTSETPKQFGLSVRCLRD